MKYTAKVDKIIENLDGADGFVCKLTAKQVDEWIEREWDRPDNPKHSKKVFRQMVELCLTAFPRGAFYVGQEHSRVVYFDTNAQPERRFVRESERQLENQAYALHDKLQPLCDESECKNGATFAWRHGHKNLDYHWTPMIRMWWD